MVPCLDGAVAVSERQPVLERGIRAIESDMCFASAIPVSVKKTFRPIGHRLRLQLLRGRAGLHLHPEPLLPLARGPILY